MDMAKPEKIPNWIGGRACAPENSQWLDKFNPHTGERIAQLADSGAKDVALAIKIATEAFPAWSGLTPIERGKILSELAVAMKVETRELADCVALEAGKPPQDALGEVSGAIQQAEYFAGEGMRLYGRTLTSGVQGKHSYTVRQPRGVAGLIVPPTPRSLISHGKCYPPLFVAIQWFSRPRKMHPKLHNCLRN